MEVRSGPSSSAQPANPAQIARQYRPTQEARRVWMWLRARFLESPLGLIRSFYPYARPDYARTTPHQRVILAYGVITYDLAVAGMVLLYDPQARTAVDRRIHERLITLFWQDPQYGELRARADMPPFDYGPSPEETWYVFKILNTRGSYGDIADPATGRQLEIEREDGGSQPYTWDQWQPISGENAWLARYALRVHQRWAVPGALSLARQLANTALALQAKNGGIRYAPRGTWLYDVDPYEIISTENCLSWYGVFEELATVCDHLGDASAAARYRAGLSGLSAYLTAAWDPHQHLFRQSISLSGQGSPIGERFATDVQSWAVLALGADGIARVTGDTRATYDILTQAVRRAGVFDENDLLAGMDFTDYHVLRRSPLRSVEWGYGFLMALQEGARYYRSRGDASAARELSGHASALARALAGMRLPDGTFRYADAPSNNIDVGFGWRSPCGKGENPWVSVASTAWSVFWQLGVNPLRPDALPAVRLSVPRQK